MEENVTKANKAWYVRQVRRVVIGIIGTAIVAGSFGGAYAYYQLYVAKTGVQLNDGTPLKRGDLLDMVLISAVEQAQKQNQAAQETK